MKKPQGTLSAYDLESLVNGSYVTHSKLLHELYEKLMRGEKCGLQKDDIVTIKHPDPHKQDVVLLKESALNGYMKATGLMAVERPDWMNKGYLGVALASDRVFGVIHKTLYRTFEDLYKKLQSGEISSNILPKDTIKKKITPKITTYYIKTDPEIIRQVALLYGFKMRDQAKHFLEGEDQSEPFISCEQLAKIFIVSNVTAKRYLTQLYGAENLNFLQPGDIKEKAFLDGKRTYYLKTSALNRLMREKSLKVNPNQTIVPFDGKSFLVESDTQLKPVASKTAKFKSASQTVRDAWGDEWTTTYSRMPRDNNDR